MISRLVDRRIRPLFPSNFNHEVQLNISLISADDMVHPDAFVALAASAALMISGFPFKGPISEVRAAGIDGTFVINSVPKMLAQADIAFQPATPLHFELKNRIQTNTK